MDCSIELKSHVHKFGSVMIFQFRLCYYKVFVPTHTHTKKKTRSIPPVKQKKWEHQRQKHQKNTIQKNKSQESKNNKNIKNKKKTNIYIPWNQTWKSQAASLRSSPSLNTLVLQSQRWVNESKLGTMGARWSWMAWVPGSGRERSASIPEGERGSHETTAFGFSCRPFLVVARSN